MKLKANTMVTGLSGTAINLMLVGVPDKPDWAATIDVWYLWCPGQSAAWNNYLLSIIHLRPIDGVPPAQIRVPGATHEIILFALNPKNNPRPLDNTTWKPLSPLNFVEQIELPNDQAARSLLARCVKAVMNGILWAEPLLSGQVEPWKTFVLESAEQAKIKESKTSLNTD